MIFALALFWHGVHMSTATVDYQSQKKSFEIMVTMSADHMEEILRKNSGREIEIDRTPDARKLASQYVLGRFSLKDGAGKLIPLRWVGWEIKGGNVNCYLEGPAVSETGVKLRDEILLDWQRDQINRVLPKRDGKGRPPQMMFWVGNAGEYLPITF